MDINDPVEADVTELLEDQVLSLNLDTYIATLLGCRESVQSAQKSLEEILGSRLELVLTDGMSVLSKSQFDTLLDNPNCLNELQEQVFIRGGKYWKSRIEVHQQEIAEDRDAESDLAKGAEKPVQALETQLHQLRRWGGFVSAIAASLLCITSYGWMNSAVPVGPEWDWTWTQNLTSVRSADEFTRQVSSKFSRVFWPSDTPVRETRKVRRYVIRRAESVILAIEAIRNASIPEGIESELVQNRCTSAAQSLRQLVASAAHEASTLTNSEFVDQHDQIVLQVYELFDSEE